jgi:hypothetical protein
MERRMVPEKVLANLVVAGATATPVAVVRVVQDTEKVEGEEKDREGKDRELANQTLH